MTAIMGASGSGKTTLINVLSSRSIRDNKLMFDGQLYVNDMPVDDLSQIKNIIGFVPQEDIVPTEATVREVFELYGTLRGVQNLRVKVKQTIKDLSLTKCQKNIIGKTFERGISGGELKRTSIGIELMSYPDILFLDEPTTGLDATTALEIIMLLKKICVQRKVGIVAVIHQPRPEILEMFDQVLVLSEGNLIFNGTLGQIEKKLADMDFFVSKFETSADFLMKLIDIHQIKTNLAKYFDMSENKIQTLANVVLQERVDALTKAEESYSKAKRSSIIQSVEQKKSFSVKKSSLETPLLEPFSVQEEMKESIDIDDYLLTRLAESKNQKHLQIDQFNILNFFYNKFFLRNRIGLLIMVMQQVVCLTFIFIIFRNLEDPKKDTIVALDNRNGLAAVLTMYGFFTGFWSDVEIFVRRQKLFRRDQEGQYYDGLPYFLANQLYNLPYFTVLMFVVCTFLFFAIHLNFHPDFFFNWLYFFYFVYVGGYIAGSSLGSVISVLCDHVQEITVIMAFIIPPLTIATGYFANIKSTTIVIKIFSYLSPSRFSYQGILVNELLNKDDYINSCVTYVDCNTNPSRRCQVQLQPPESIKCDPKKYMDFYQTNRWSNAIFILILVVFYRVLGYAIFTFRNRQKMIKFKKLTPREKKWNPIVF